MRITMIDGIRFEDYTVEHDRPLSGFGVVGEADYEGRLEASRIAREKAMSAVRDNASKLKNLGFKRVEYDTVGGFSGRRKTKGNFVAITVMHYIRILKR